MIFAGATQEKLLNIISYFSLRSAGRAATTSEAQEDKLCRLRRDEISRQRERNARINTREKDKSMICVYQEQFCRTVPCQKLFVITISEGETEQGMFYNKII